ncbi:hypothetical protein ACWCL1_08170 [Ligilactobacillus sp. LYQ135]
MKPNELKFQKNVIEYINTIENPPVVEAFKSKAKSGKGLMILDIIIFVINIICFALLLGKKSVILQILPLINSAVILCFQFFLKLSTYEEISKVSSQIKFIEDNHTKIIKCVKLIKFLGWTLSALTFSILLLGQKLNGAYYYCLSISLIIVSVIYGVMDKLIWQFFNSNNTDLRNLLKNSLRTEKGQ